MPDLAADSAPERLRADVTTLVEANGPRHYEAPDALVSTAAFVHERFAALGLVVEDHDVVNGVVNVVGRVGPAKGPVVVVGAHYDAYRETPGADDNASGVAGLLELARRLAADPPAYTVELVAYPYEEPPYFRSREMGSRVHAERMVRDDRDLVLMLSLECIGYFSDERRSQHFPSLLMRPFYPSEGNFVAVVGRSSQGAVVREVRAAMRAQDGVAVESIAAPTWIPGIDWSDHLAYWAEGYDAVMITDTALNRNPHYHEPTDVPDTLDYARMAAVIDGVEAVVRAQGADE